MSSEIELVLSKPVKPSQLADVVTEDTVDRVRVESVVINPKIGYLEVNLSMASSPNQIKISKKFPGGYPVAVGNLLDFILEWIDTRVKAI